MVKWISFLASNETFQVRALVGLLDQHGVRGVVVSARLVVIQKVWVRFPSFTLKGGLRREASGTKIAD